MVGAGSSLEQRVHPPGRHDGIGAKGEFFGRFGLLASDD